MKRTRQALLYVVTIVTAVVVIAIVLRYGSELSLPFDRSADLPAQTLEKSSSGVLQLLRSNVAHPLSQLFIQFLVVLLAARLTGHAFSRIGIPAVVGEMTAGILLGPSLFGLLAPDAFQFVFPPASLGTLSLVSQVGICLFMFVVGMELNVSQVRTQAQSAVAVSHSSIVVPFLFGVALAYPLFEEMAGTRATFVGFALFMGISMSITAFPVLARILQERGLTHTRLGNTALTCAAVEDVTAWIILAFVAAIGAATSLGPVLASVALVILFFGVMTLGVRPLVRAWLGERRLREAEPSRSTLAIIVCAVLGAALCTEVIGIHALFGAFLAGTIMPNVGEFRARIAARIERFSSALLVPLFFAFTGLRTQVALFDGVHGWLLCGLIILLAIVGKLGAGAVAARLSGLGWRESLQLGALMNTRGLMELVALNIGYDLGILSPKMFTMLVLMAIATTFMTGPLLTLFGEVRWRGAKLEDSGNAERSPGSMRPQAPTNMP